MKKKVGMCVIWFMLFLGVPISSKYILEENKQIFAQEYLYDATLDLSSVGWSGYNTGLNFDLTGGTAGTIYPGEKLSVISEKTNKSGNKVAYVYSESLKKNCYVSSRFLKKIEGTDLKIETAAKLNFKRSDKLKEFASLVDELYESKNYKNVESLSSKRASNIAIKGVYADIESMHEMFIDCGIDTLEKKIYVATYNNQTEELEKNKKFCESFYQYFELIKESLTDYKNRLSNASYFEKLFNGSKINNTINDCTKLITGLEEVLSEDIYAVQTNAVESPVKKVIEAAEQEYGGKPQYLPGGKAYNGLKSSTRSWCVDFVQFLLKKSGEEYVKNDLCGTVDKLAISVSDFGGTFYITCDSSYKYYDENKGKLVIARKSLQEQNEYTGKITMNFDYDSSMTVKPGDIIIYGCAPTYRFAHVGLCVEVNEDGSFKTIEGNVSAKIGNKNYSNQCLNAKERSLDWSASDKAGTHYILGVLRPDYYITIDDRE